MTTTSIRVLDDRLEAELLAPGTPLRGCCGMAFDHDGAVLVGNVHSARISRIDPATGAVTAFVDVARAVLGTDDITSDGQGTCWTTCATGLGGESVYRIDRSGRVRAIYDGLTGANGIHFDRRSGRLFVGQYGGGNGLYEIDPDGRTPPRLITKAFASTNAMDMGGDGRLLVTVAGGRIARIDPDSGAHEVLDVQFPHNSALKVTVDGTLLVTGYRDGAGCLWRVAADGRSMQTLSEGSLPPLDNLLCAPDGRRLYVSSLRDATVLELDLADGCRVLRSFSACGVPGITSMAVAGDALYVNDGLTLRRLDRSARALLPTGGSFFNRNGFPVPGCLRTDVRGRLVLATGCQFPLANAYDGRLHVVDTADFRCRTINGGTHQGLQLPSALCDGPDAMYVAEFERGQVVAIDLDGDDSRRRVVARSLQGPLGLARVGDELYIAETLGQRISLVDLRSGRQDVLVAAGLGRPTALERAPDGDLLALDAHGARLLKVSRERGAITVLADGLPIEPVLASNWPLVAVGNALAVDREGGILIGGNVDGSVWRLALHSGVRSHP